MPRFGRPIVLINAPNSGPEPIVSAESHQPHPERGTLSRELIDFLIELSIALQKFAIYPAGHPMLATTVARLEQRLAPLLDLSDTVSLGVARNQLVIEGIATDEHHAVLRDLAQRLHDHHLGAVKIIRGVHPDELREFLVTLGVEHGKDATPVGLLPEAELPSWSHLRLYPLAYEHLELLDEEEDTSAPASERQRGAGSGGARAARLWVGLARAALAGGGAGRARSSRPAIALETLEGVKPGSSDDGAADASPESAREEAEAEEHAAADPEAVARAIDEHQREAAYDQVIVGYLLQIADELRTAEGRDAVALRGRVSRLVGSMKPQTLRTLLSMGNDASQRRRFVLDATQGLAVDAVLELLRAAADVSHQTISHSMLRLLSKLATHAEGDTGERRVDADEALRENVRMLVGQWTLADPNPDAYRAVLEGMSRSQPAPAATTHPTHPVEDERLLQMALEVGVAGESTWRSLEALVSTGRIATVIAMLNRAPRPAVAEQVWERLASLDRVRAMLDARQPDWATIERLVVKMGLGAADVLVDVLDGTDDGRRQTQIVSILAKLGDDAGALVVRRLAGARPETQGQLLALVGRLGQTPEGLDLFQWMRNPSPTVRREAIKLLCRRPDAREAAITAGLLDADDRTVLVALNEATVECPRSVVSILMSRVDRDDIAAPLRALAIRAAASVRSPDVVEWVLRFTMVGRKSFFGGERLPPKSPELLAALGALGTWWRNDSRAAGVLARALKSSDPEIRSAAQTVFRPTSSVGRGSITMRAVEES